MTTSSQAERSFSLLTMTNKKKVLWQAKNTQQSQSTYLPCLFVPGLLNPLFSFYFQPFNYQCSCTIFITSKPAKSSITGAIFQTRRNFFAIKTRKNISRMSSHNSMKKTKKKKRRGMMMPSYKRFLIIALCRYWTLWCQIHRQAIKRYVSLRKMFLWMTRLLLLVADNRDPP